MAIKELIDLAAQKMMTDPELGRPLLVLEAGCGSTSDVDLSCENTIVGIDIDSEQLRHNEILDQKIHGDLQTYALPQSEFDLIACVDVLEHLPSPERAIINMASSLKPGGYLLVAGPEPYSYKGLVAKYTPHSMRSSIFRLLTGRPPEQLRRIHGNGQIFIPTYLRSVCSRKNLVREGGRLGLCLVFEQGFDGYSGSGLLRSGFSPLLPLAKGFSRLVELCSRRRINLLLADFVVLFKKMQTADAPAAVRELGPDGRAAVGLKRSA